jgi:transposase
MRTPFPSGAVSSRLEAYASKSNICERGLKKVILHRKNALFYKSLNGAQVGDLFMSLTHTCELSDTNPFDYLTQLQHHASQQAKNPRENCARLTQLDTAA